MSEDTIIKGHPDRHRHSQDDRRDADRQVMAEVLVRGVTVVADHQMDPVEDLVADHLVEDLVAAVMKR